MPAPRRLYLKEGAIFRNRLDDDDSYIEIEIVSIDQTRRLVSADISSYQNGALQFREPLAGGFRQVGFRAVLCLRDSISNQVEFRVLIRLSKKKPDKDRFVIRTEQGLKSALRQLGLPPTSPGGSAEDPDAELFERGVQGSNNTPQPINLPFPTTLPQRVDRPTSGPTRTSTLVPGSIVCRGSSGVGQQFLYDFAGRLYLFDGGTASYVDYGTVEYGTTGTAGTPWYILIQPPTGSTFVATDFDAQAVIP